MRSSVIGSSMVHVALLVVLLTVRANAPIVIPGPEVVQVALVEPGPIQPVPVEAKAPEPEEKLPPVKPTEETGVKLAPPKPPKPAKKPTEKPKETPPPTRAAALPFARVGNTGLGAQVSVEAADFEFTYYLVRVRELVTNNCTPPAGLSTGQAIHCVIYFRIGRGGEVSGARIETSSGAQFFDRSALRAVVISNPLPPLPLGYSGSDLGVYFGFEYSGP